MQKNSFFDKNITTNTLLLHRGWWCNKLHTATILELLFQVVVFTVTLANSHEVWGFV